MLERISSSIGLKPAHSFVEVNGHRATVISSGQSADPSAQAVSSIEETGIVREVSTTGNFASTRKPSFRGQAMLQEKTGKERMEAKSGWRQISNIPNAPFKHSFRSVNVNFVILYVAQVRRLVLALLSRHWSRQLRC